MPSSNPPKQRGIFSLTSTIITSAASQTAIIWDAFGPKLKNPCLSIGATWNIATFAGALRNIDYDLIITGRQAIDGDTAQVGPQIAEHLDLPLISYAQDIKVEGDSVIVQRQYDDRYHVLKAKMPCVITALSELNEPRYMTPGGIFDAYDAEITTWGRKDLKDVDDSNLGLAGSPTQIAKASDKVRKGKGVMMTAETAEEGVEYIMDKLLTKHVI